MKVIRAQQTINIPKGVEVSVDARRVTVKAASGNTLKRDFRHLPVSIKKIDNGKKVEVSLYYGLSKQVACLRTVCSHIDNMITGTTKKFRYCMRLVYAHFPINATIVDGGKGIEIRNFLGEKIVRSIDMLGDDTRIRKSEMTKDEIIIEGSDIDLVSRSVALIHQSCLVKNKDIRKFLDGIYVSAKGAIQDE